jgi:hypothetical protein
VSGLMEAMRRIYAIWLVSDDDAHAVPSEGST